MNKIFKLLKSLHNQVLFTTKALLTITFQKPVREKFREVNFKCLLFKNKKQIDMTKISGSENQEFEWT